MLSICPNIMLLSGTSHPALAAEVAGELQVSLGKVDIERFPDEEISLQIKESVRGRDVFVFQSIARDPNYYLLELLIMVDALKRSSPKSITAVIPYFGYCRQDRQARSREPITAKLIANMIECAGTSHVLTMDLHSRPVQGFFNIPVEHLAGRPSLVEAFKKDYGDKGNNLVVVAPDLGSSKLAQGYANMLGAEIAVLDKLRHSASNVEILALTGNVKGKDVLLADDMVSTAGTLMSAAKACQEKGAKRIFAIATHGLLVANSVQALEQSPIEALYISNTIPATQSILGCKKVRIVSIAATFGQAIACMLSNESLSYLYE